MTRFSREEIEEHFAASGIFHNNADTLIIKQLLEENRILREGLEFYASMENWSVDVEMMFDSTAETVAEKDEGNLARETLTKADAVGK